MRRQIWWRTRCRAWLAMMVAVMTAASAGAQTAAPLTPPPLPGAKTPPAIVSPSSKEVPSVKDAPSDDAAPAKPSTGDVPTSEPKASGDASSAKEMILEGRPVAILKGAADWDDGFKTINSSLQTIRDALAKANIKPIGYPMTVFRETDDNSFKFETMVPIDPAVDTKVKLDSNVTFSQSPAGKVLRFQHRGAYEDIDSMYEAITAYLDDKGFNPKNLFMEEYLNSVKNADDTNLQVNIYVLIK